MNEHYRMKACVKSSLAPSVFLQIKLGEAIERGYWDVIELIMMHPNALAETRMLAEQALAEKGA